MKSGHKMLRPFLLIATVALLLFTTACTQQSAPTTPSTPSTPAPADPKAGWPKQFLFTAAPKGGAWYPIAAVLTEVIQEATGTTGTIIEAGGNANVIAINDGKAHFGMAQVFSTVDGIKGKPPFEKPLPNVQGMMTLFDGYWQMVVPKDSDIQSISDLKGKRVSCGVAGQATVNQCAMVLKAYGMTFDDLAKLENVPYNDAGLMMKDKQLDAISPGITGFPVSSLIDVGASRPLRVLPISDEVMKKISDNNPAFLPATFPANVYAGQDQPVPVLKTASGLIVSPDLPESYVYTVIKAIDENTAKIRAASPTMKNFDIKTAFDGMAVELHPGVVKYLKEIGLR